MRFAVPVISALFLIALALGGAAALAQQSDGSVLFVAPHRLVIDPTERVDVISVTNKSDRTRRYDLSLVDQVMGPDGVTARQDTFDYSVKRMVKYVPKRFSLNPGERQTIRVQVTRPQGLADGDYHSHLLFREVPLSVKDKAQLKEERREAENQVSFEIRTLYGIAVPIIVQHGEIDSSMTMSDPVVGKTADGKQHTLAVAFTREGNAEAAGKISAQYVAEGKEPVPLMDAQWIRLYRETDQVQKTFVLANMPADAKGGKIVVSLVRDENDESKTLRKEIPFNG
jgi:hypothetical protein